MCWVMSLYLFFLYRSEINFEYLWRWRLMSATLSIAIIAWVVLNFLSSTQSILSTIAHTEYPGQRIAEGGGLTLVQLFSNLIALPKEGSLGSLAGNICESASFLIFAPFLGLLFLM